MNTTAAAIIMARSIPEPNTGCWLWLGTLMGPGYGRLSRSAGLGQWAHRASYKAFVGEIPERAHVLHRCDVRCCVNPEHLFLGTHSQNMLDMYSKGRRSHPFTKLNANDVRFIRSAPKYTPGLATRFGVSESVISRIRSGKAWKYTGD